MSLDPSATNGMRAPAAHDDNEDTGDRKVALKKQKREYKDEKKRVAQELVAALRDPTVVVMADWLKVRGTLRKWNRYFCVLKPGLMMIYKSNKTEKQGHWVGTILLNTCQLIERPSKKDGFCFKLYHPMDQNIWATRGPLGESHGAVTLQPLPTTHLICRAPSEQAGGCWMDALQLALRCSGLLMRTMHKLSDAPRKEEEAVSKDSDSVDCDPLDVAQQNPDISETEAEKHFSGLDDDNDVTTAQEGDVDTLGADEESNYVASEPEQLGILAESAQTEDMGDENKSLVWSLLKQIRPGMDLSRVTLPTFILEPRSFLEKLADFYYHSDLLTEAAAEEDPLKRMIKVVRFYLSGFYKKPKGLKKPYNPILGETFRCKWEHPDGSTSFYVAEQVSHHPPISSLFLTNRRGGYNIAGTIFAKSKYYGNSLSAMMLGTIDITLLARGETYSVTLPYANCKGLMIGTLSMEYGGQVKIECNRTAYVCVVDFKLKPFLGGSMNVISGAVKLGKEALVEIGGTWDGEITASENGKKTVLWAPTPDVIKRRLRRYEIPIEEQGEWESKKLWLKVSEAIARDDQVTATKEKTILEDEQRARAKLNPHHKPRFFKHEPLSKNYDYIYADYRPWDINDDIKQVECGYVISTISKHGAFTRSASIASSSQRRKQSGDSESTTDSASLHRSKKKSRTPGDKDRLQRLQDTLDRCAEALQRLEGYTESNGYPVTQLQLLTSFAVFAVLQALILPLILKFK